MVLVTGASGFLGGHLVKALNNDCLTLGRTAPSADNSNHFYANFNDRSSCLKALQLSDVVVHCAARVHVMVDEASDPLSEFRIINTRGTLNIAQQAADAGVKRFIFISSIKVNGESTVPYQPYHYNDQVLPEDAYGQSKAEAEEGLRKIAKETGLEVVIIRPPLVYGPGVKGNFASMMKLASKNLPLPLGAIHNKRSLVALDNLVDLIVVCIDHPKAANETFLVSDDQDVSTTQLLKKMTIAAGKKPWLIPLPMNLIQLGATILGKKSVSDRLCGSLQVDISHTTDALNWTPPIGLEEGLLRCFQKLIFIYLVGLLESGSPVFRQERVGKNRKPFILVKFRTMSIDTASVASHLASSASITRMGALLRKTKLDELPQLWNVLKGEMSLVGPRPGLFNQKELTAAREVKNVFKVRPGITGLAQVNDIDMSTPELLADTDSKMIAGMNINNYFKYIFQTVLGAGAGDRIK
jgi:nucleoside-diphosphate-sugar epimerase/lipopolysaccharide/colanic/teichoic acid biosynthesis glycosyltransferase